MVPPHDLARSTAIVAFLVLGIGWFWLLPSSSRKGKQHIFRGMVPLFLLGTLFTGCASQQVAPPLSSSPDSTPGKQWHTQKSGTPQALLGIAWAGSQWVTVGDGGTILTSPNGHAWTQQSSPTQETLYAPAWSGSQWVAVGKDGTILASPDGHAWTQQSSPTQETLYALAWSGSQWV
ncbi:MAG TPA: hypothetical protein VFN35_24375, partial [Ktedonobacteraceae bacterium]|nr:hypothetical protein [Ktedonobacteraceae bacterium]